MVYTLVGALLRRGLEIGVALPQGGAYVERFRTLGAAVYEVPLDTVALPAAAAFRQALSVFHPALAHSHGKGAGLFARTLRSGIPQIHTYHGFYPPNGILQRTLYLSAERFLLTRTAAIVSVSEGEASEIRRVFPGSRVTVIRNVIHRGRVLAASLVPLEGELRTFTEQHRGDLLVTMVARNDPLKNHRLAAEALRQAMGTEKSIAAVFVGAAENTDVQRLAGEYPGRVLVIPHMDSVAPLLRASGIVLLTSRQEALPLVVLEALALGRAVVATDIPGIREIVRHGENGLLCAQEPASVTSAILRLARSSAERTEIGDRAAAGVAAESVEQWAARYVEVYASVVRESIV